MKQLEYVLTVERYIFWNSFETGHEQYFKKTDFFTKFDYCNNFWLTVNENFCDKILGKLSRTKFSPVPFSVLYDNISRQFIIGLK